MSELFLSPKEFQGQIDKFESGVSTIKGLTYNLDAQGVKLTSVDRFLECIEEFNKTIKAFGQLSDLDTQSMKLIKAKWMNLDSDIATKTLGEVLFRK